MELFISYAPYLVLALGVLWLILATVFAYANNKLGFWFALSISTICINTWIVVTLMLHYCSALAIIITQALASGAM